MSIPFLERFVLVGSLSRAALRIQTNNLGEGVFDQINSQNLGGLRFGVEDDGCLD